MQRSLQRHPAKRPPPPKVIFWVISSCHNGRFRLKGRNEQKRQRRRAIIAGQVSQKSFPRVRGASLTHGEATPYPATGKKISTCNSSLRSVSFRGCFRESCDTALRRIHGSIRCA